MLAFLLFLTGKMLQFYKTPTISHVIFIVDMFDACVEITFSDASSFAVSYAAVVLSEKLSNPILRRSIVRL